MRIFCRCGCGEKFDPLDKHGRQRFYAWGHNARGLYKTGRDVPCQICKKPIYRKQKELKKKRRFFCSPKCYAVYKSTLKGPKSPSWKGGKKMLTGGYVALYRPLHPAADRSGYVREHRLVMENKLGRYLKSEEIVHHKDGKKAHNISSNLELTNRAAHVRHHKPRRIAIPHPLPLKISA